MEPAAPHRTQSALLLMRRNREQLRAALLPESSASREFPRSMVFRWLQKHVSARSLLTGAVTAIVTRPALLQVLLQSLRLRRAASASKLLRRGG